jgi:hypothetical protein
MNHQEMDSLQQSERQDVFCVAHWLAAFLAGAFAIGQ